MNHMTENTDYAPWNKVTDETKHPCYECGEESVYELCIFPEAETYFYCEKCKGEILITLVDLLKNQYLILNKVTS